MKKLFTFCVISLLLIACNNNPEWEYYTYAVEGVAFSDYDSKTYYDPTSKLNELGEEGWELVTSYTVEETVFPNFGNKEYVTGLRDNTRTKKVYFIFKRRKSRSTSRKNINESDSAAEVILTETVVETVEDSAVLIDY